MIRNFFLAAVLLTLIATPAHAEGPLRQKIREHMQQGGGQGFGHRAQTMKMAGLNVAYWLPDESAYPAPLVIFSHGLNGCKTQSVFLMKAMAEHGYVVVAPDHKDATCAVGNGLASHKPQEGLARYQNWSDQTYKDREADIKNLYDALKNDAAWSQRIDWDKVALSGHSLGGYTAFGLAGVWPSWKMSGIKALLGLSPYVGPLLPHGDFSNIDVPVMYQTGNRDLGIMPSLMRKGGAFEKTGSPAWLVEFRDAGHFTFTDLQPGAAAQKHMIDYSLWFLDHTLKGDNAPFPHETGVIAQKEK